MFPDFINIILYNNNYYLMLNYFVTIYALQSFFKICILCHNLISKNPRGIIPVDGYTGRLHPKEMPFLCLTFLKGHWNTP